MADTKENILRTALRLFARDGYEAVSTSAIAGELGMTKGALYKHYKNKRAIFDSIVERMYQIDAERSQACAVPQEVYADAPESYRGVTIKAVQAFTRAQFRFWTEDAFASDFRRMLKLEQYRSQEMAALYSQCLTAGPVAYMADIFREMQARSLLQPGDPQQLALEFYAPMYLLMDLPASEENAALLEAHMAAFLGRHAGKEGDAL